MLTCKQIMSTCIFASCICDIRCRRKKVIKTIQKSRFLSLPSPLSLSLKKIESYLHVDIIILHVNIIILHFDIIKRGGGVFNFYEKSIIPLRIFVVLKSAFNRLYLCYPTIQWCCRVYTTPTFFFFTHYHSYDIKYNYISTS